MWGDPDLCNRRFQRPLDKFDVDTALGIVITDTAIRDGPPTADWSVAGAGAVKSYPHLRTQIAIFPDANSSVQALAHR
jgi:hypothetical protein